MPADFDRLDERLSNLINRIDISETDAKQRSLEFRTECFRRFDWMEAKLLSKHAGDELHIENMRGRIASLEQWRGYITGGIAVLVLLWGGMLAWLKLK